MSKFEGEEFYILANNFLDDWHVRKSLDDVKVAIRFWIMTKEDVINNIGYLINKYHNDNIWLQNDFERFLNQI